MGEVINKRPLHFEMAIDMLSLIKTQLVMGDTENKILIDIADQLTAVWKDGAVFGEREGVEKFANKLIEELLNFNEPLSPKNMRLLVARIEGKVLSGDYSR